MNKDTIINEVQQFNLQQINQSIKDESSIRKYNKILNIILHTINACSIICSVLTNTININISYALIVINILNSIINYELTSSHNTLNNNLKVINNLLHQNNIDQNIIVPLSYTPTPTLINA